MQKGSAKGLHEKGSKNWLCTRVYTREKNLDMQFDALEAAGCDEIFTDQGVSGAAIERDGLSQALASVEEGDTLIVWKLDRLGRSLDFLADLITEYGREGRDFVALQDGIDTTTSGGSRTDHREYRQSVKLQKSGRHDAAHRSSAAGC